MKVSVKLFLKPLKDLKLKIISSYLTSFHRECYIEYFEYLFVKISFPITKGFYSFCYQLPIQKKARRAGNYKRKKESSIIN